MTLLGERLCEWLLSQPDVTAVPAHLLRHGADSAVMDLLNLAAHHLDLACRRIQSDTYMDKKNKGKI